MTPHEVGMGIRKHLLWDWQKLNHEDCWSAITDTVIWILNIRVRLKKGGKKSFRTKRDRCYFLTNISCWSEYWLCGNKALFGYSFFWLLDYRLVQISYQHLIRHALWNQPLTSKSTLSLLLLKVIMAQLCNLSILSHNWARYVLSYVSLSRCLNSSVGL